MRRSKAPSALNKAKRLCTADGLVTERHSSEPEDEDYKWGSGSSVQYGETGKLNRNECKRIFNVVWREVSTKKHKTWKGDGTLEVNENVTKAVLKDEMGKYLGCLTKPINIKLGPDVQMIVGNKEIEIQEEIKQEELLLMRKSQALNRNWGEEEWISPEDLKEEQKKPKGGFKFKPLLVLKSPQTPVNDEHLTKRGNQTNLEKPGSSTKVQLTTSSCNNLPKDILCFIRPSELQQYLFQKVLDYYDSMKSLKVVESMDIPQILQHICNHPSFINHNPCSNELINHLIPLLPDWTEMGPFDSGKLEFVQFFLKGMMKDNRKNCIILAKNISTSNMLQGLCDFMHLKCLRLNANFSEEDTQKIFTEFTANYDNSIQILMINSLDLLQNIKPLNRPQDLIVFDEFSLTMEHIQNCSVYYLVTAFSIEELLLLNNDNSIEILQELQNLTNLAENCCYLHTKIQCKCLDLKLDKENTSLVENKSHKFITNWKHLTNPFDEKFLRTVHLDNCAENIVTIFYKIC